MASINNDDAEEERLEREQHERLVAERRAAMLQRGPVVVAQRVIALNNSPSSASSSTTPSTKPIGAGKEESTGVASLPSNVHEEAAAAAKEEEEEDEQARGIEGHRYYADVGVITMPVKGNMPAPLPTNATREDIELFNRKLVVARRQQALAEHMDLVYRFVGWVAHDLGQGYAPEQFWTGEASGQGALHMLLYKATQHWMDQSTLIDPAKPRHGQFHAYDAMAQAGRAKLNVHPARGADAATMPVPQQKQDGDSAASSSSSAASPAPRPKVDALSQTDADRQGYSAKEMLGRMLNNALDGTAITETALRAYDMYFFHDGEYIPPNGHAVQTPREEVELAIKFAQLERFFHTNSADDGGDADPSTFYGHSVVVDNRVVHEVFLQPTMHKGITDATLYVHNVCRRAHIAQIDLMTHQRVAPNFSRLVASMINLPSELNPRRPVQPLAMRAVAKNDRGLKRFFENVDYADDGFLADMRTYNPSAEARRHETERVRARFTAQTGTYYSDVKHNDYRAHYHLADSGSGGAGPLASSSSSSSSLASMPTPHIVVGGSLGQAMTAARSKLLSVYDHRPSLPVNSTTSLHGGGGTLNSARAAVTPVNVSIARNPHITAALPPSSSRKRASPEQEEAAAHRLARVRTSQTGPSPTRLVGRTRAPLVINTDEEGL